MIRICSTLAEAGYQVKLIGRKLPSSKPLEEQHYESVRLFCFFKKGKLFYLEYNIRLFWYLLFYKFDAVCGVDLDTLLPCFIVSKIKNKPVIYDAHEYFTEVPEVVDRPAVKKIWSILERTLVPKVKYAYTVCESLARIFNQKYNTPFEVIRNVPFRTKQENRKSRPNPDIIIYQGALNEGRGLEESIQAMQWIQNAELWLVGEGDLSSQLRAMVQELNLISKVHFKGYVKPTELKQLTAQASIGLNLLENKGLSYYYSLANKAFDYIQAELPAINMAYPEYIHLNEEYETAILMASLDPEKLAEQINLLLEDDLKYQGLKQNCKLAAEEFIWENEKEILLQFYKKIF